MANVRDLRQIVWTPAGKTCNLFTSLGVTHGFGGQGDPQPAAHSLKQVHGTQVVPTSERTAPGVEGRCEADGIYTTTSGELVAAKSADCLPVLFADDQRRIALAVHAGWRGLASGILGRAITTAGELGIPARDLSAAIGPAIGRERYEVGEEVVEALFGPALGLSAAEASLCVAKGQKDRWHADLLLAAVLTLRNHGIKASRIAAIQACTFTGTEWHSYRREGKGVGSNWSWIKL